MSLVQKKEVRKSLRRPVFLSEYVQKYSTNGNQADNEIAAIDSFENTRSDSDKHKDETTKQKHFQNLCRNDEHGMIDLQQVLREGDREEVHQALSQLYERPWIEINKLSEDDFLGPLHVAVRRGHTYATEQLLQHGADIKLVGEDGKQAIHYAAKHYQQPIKISTESSKSCLQVLIQNGADINAKDNYLSTPLHYASERGHLNAVKMIIETGKADLQARDDHSSLPLHEAAKRGHVQIITTILENTKSRSKLLEAKDENGCSPLILACRNGFTQASAVLLKYACQVNAGVSLARLIDQDNDLSTPLHAAIDSGCLDAVQYLLGAWEKQAADIQNSYDGTLRPEFSSYVDIKCGHGKTALHSAAGCGVIDIVQAVLSHGPDLNARDNSKATPLWIAAHQNHIDVTKLLLDKNANCETRNNEGLTPLMVASRDGHSDIVRLLLNRGADIGTTDVLDRSCCFLAAEHGRTEVVQELMSLPHGKALLQECDRRGNSPMHVAAAQGKIGIVKIFVSNGASLDQRNDKEQTPLHIAALNGQLNVVQEIVNADRSSLNDQDENSSTALHLAALNGRTSTLQKLLLFGANSNDRDSKGRTALDICVNAGWTESARVLLDANPSLIDNKARDMATPLHTACKQGNANLVKLLLSRKADVKSCLPNGRNALDIAIDNYHEDCARTLLEDDSWRFSLRNAHKESGSETIATPLRKLVELMPDVAEFALTKCMTMNEARPDDRNYMITFNYEFLDDAYDVTKWNQTFSKSFATGTNDDYLGKREGLEMKYIIPTTENWKQLRNETIESQDWKLEKNAKPYSESGAILSENHILNKMINSKSERLLCHPTVSSLLNLKWSMFGRYIYWINVLTYLIFFVSLNVYMTTTPPRFAVNITGTEEQVSAGNKCLTIVTQAQDVWGSDCQGPSSSRYVFITLVLAFSSIQLLKEIFQMIHQRLKYFLDFTNYIELSLYILCILVFIDIDPLANDTGIREKWQWECGAFAVLISWLNLLLYARRTAWLGIYVFMVTSVGFTFLRFAAVLVLFVLGFSFSFYVLLQNQYPFYTPALACVKTFVMMIGEMDYTSIFLAHYTSSEYHDVVQYDTSSNIVFIIFAVLMSLLLTNLLVGLAVDDITSVQDHALVQRLALQVEGLLDMEYAMPEILRRRWVVRERRVFPNKYEGRNTILRWLVEEKEMKEKHIRNTIAPPDNEIDKLRSEVKELRYELVDASEAIKMISQQQLECTQLIENLSVNIKKLVDKSS